MIYCSLLAFAFAVISSVSFILAGKHDYMPCFWNSSIDPNILIVRDAWACINIAFDLHTSKHALMAGVEEVCIIQNKELSLQLFGGYSKNRCNLLASHIEQVLTVSEKAYADAIEVNEINLLSLAQVLFMSRSQRNPPLVFPIAYLSYHLR